MMYSYSEMRGTLFTEEGHIMFLKVRDRANELLQTAGAFRLQEVISVCTGDTWMMLACVDRLAELGEIRDVTAGMHVAGQHRVFVRA